MPYRSFCALRLAFTLAMGSMMGAAMLPASLFAQTVVSGPAVITGVIPSEISPQQARIIVTFNQSPPRSVISTSPSGAGVVTLADTRLGSGVAIPANRFAGVQGLTLAQNGSALALNIMGVSPPRITIADLGPRALAITVETNDPHGASATASRVPSPQDSIPAPEEQFEVVPLRFADVSEIVGLLTTSQGVKPNDNFTPQEPAFGSAGVNGFGSTFPQAALNVGLNQVPSDPLGSSVDDTIGVDRRLNAIILRGSAARIEQLKARIAKLDVPVNSVILETVFVELTESGARNVGFNFANAAGQIGTLVYQYNSGGLSSNGGSSISDTTMPFGAISASLQAALAAQIQLGEGKIISRPRIAAQSGSTAKIITGDALPILTSIALSGVNAVQQQVQYVNVGVTLQIAPRVSADGFVTSHVFAVVSTVTGVSQGYPTISQREALTIATVHDGESFVIGGLTQENRIASRSHIPLLGDLPGLGNLFRSQTSSRAKTDLYIVVTPRIVRGNPATLPEAVQQILR